MLPPYRAFSRDTASALCWALAVLLLSGAGCRRAEESQADVAPRAAERSARNDAHDPQHAAAEASTDAPATMPPEAAPSRDDPPRPPIAPQQIPQFAALHAETGIDFVRYEDIRGRCRILESTGGGVAMIDLDADGLLDLMFPDGCVLPADEQDAVPAERRQQMGGQLYRNLGGMQFAPVTESSGIVQGGYGQGCAVGDIDGDGFDDLYITAVGGNHLWRNNGDGTFTDVTARALASVPQWSTSAAFADLNHDGHLDLYVCNYLEDALDDPVLCPSPRAPTGYTQCPPSKYPAQSDVLLLNLGDGRFWDATRATGIAALPRKALGVAIADWDGNRPIDIYVANDGEPNSLFLAQALEEVAPPEVGRSIGVPRYVETALANGAALSRSGFAQASMGIAAGDIDADQRLDLVLTHFYGDTNTVYRNLGEGRFDDVTRRTGLAGPSRQVLGWGAVLQDFNCDGRPDLFIANGHVEDRTWLDNPEPLAMPPQLFASTSPGRFVEVSAWAGSPFSQSWQGRGVAAGDLDRDGRIDLAVSRLSEPATLLHNRSETPRTAIGLRLVGVASNRNAIGARVEVVAEDKSVRDVLWTIGGGSYLSSGSLALQLVLDDGPPVRLRVQWPNGSESLHTIHVDFSGILVEPQPENGGN